jgi:hypothetical protein
MSEMSLAPQQSEEDAILSLDNQLYTVLGIKGLGQWAFNMRNTAGATDEDIVRAIRYGTGTIPGSAEAHQAYLQAYPGMDKFLADKTFSGPSPESQYNEYRNDLKQSASRFGIDPMLVTNDKIASYIANGNSAAEISDRMMRASAAVATTPPETLSIMQQYYGVNRGDLVTFYLDPDQTEAMLEQRYTAAQIGAEAARQRFGVSQTEAESLAQRGFTGADANKGFAQAARQQTAFTQGAGETATREEILAGTFGDEQAAQKLERVAQSRAGRFAEGGGFSAGERGVSGLGTSATR